MVRAMQDVAIDEKSMLQLGNALWGGADYMRNQPESQQQP